MKRTTRNNILRYLVATVFVSVFVLIVSLLCAGLDWIVNKTGWPIYPVVFVTCFIYVVYFIGKGITIKDEKEKNMRDALRMEYEKGRADVIQATEQWLANSWPKYCENPNIIEAFKENVIKD